MSTNKKSNKRRKSDFSLLWVWRNFLNYIGCYYYKEKEQKYLTPIMYITNTAFLILFHRIKISKIWYTDILGNERTVHGRTSIEELIEKKYISASKITSLKKTNYKIETITKIERLNDEYYLFNNYWNPNKNRGKFI